MGCEYKGLVFCRNNGWLLDIMHMGLTVPKWVLINRTKIPQMPQNLSDQIVCQSPKVWYFDEKRLHWASVFCGLISCHSVRNAIAPITSNILTFPLLALVSHLFQRTLINLTLILNLKSKQLILHGCCGTIKKVKQS